MSQDRLQAGEANPFPNTADAESMTQDVRRAWSADLGPVGYSLDHEFRPALADADAFLFGKPSLKQRLCSGSHRYDSPLLPKLPFVVASTFAVDDELMPLPVDVIGSEVDELMDA